MCSNKVILTVDNVSTLTTLLDIKVTHNIAIYYIFIIVFCVCRINYYNINKTYKNKKCHTFYIYNTLYK